MRLYIGTFSEDEANEIAMELKKAGIRSELRHSLETVREVWSIMEGKLSELKENYGDKERAGGAIEEVEEYWEEVRKIYRDGIGFKEFDDAFLNAVMPERKEYEEIRMAAKKAKNYTELVEKFGEERVEDFFSHIVEEARLLSFIHGFLAQNGIKHENEKMHGELPSDPYMKLDISGRIEGLPSKQVIRIFKNVDVYANLIDLIYEFEKVEKILKEREEFFSLLLIMNAILHALDLIKNKMDVDEFIEKAMNIKNGEEIIMERDAVNEILRTLEKAEIIRIKKGKIILKEKKHGL